MGGNTEIKDIVLSTDSLNVCVANVTTSPRVLLTQRTNHETLQVEVVRYVWQVGVLACVVDGYLLPYRHGSTGKMCPGKPNVQFRIRH